MEKKNLAELLSGFAPEEIAKAAQDSLGLRGIRVIKDLWHNYEAIPERNDTKTGPAMHASGEGADKAVDEYSNPAPQISITKQYDEFSKQNIEGWGKMHDSMKSFQDDISAKLGALIDVLQKGAACAEPEMKAEDKEEKKEHKHEMKSNVASLWNHLGDLEVAVAKAENEIQDVENLNTAKEHIEQAEKYLDQVEHHELEEMAGIAGMKAMTAINLGWRSLAKATGLNSYDLHGYGNQADEQIPGDETKDASSDDLKEAEAKAAFYTAKLERVRKAKGLVKAEDKEEKEEHKAEAKAEHKEEEKKEPEAEAKAEHEKEDEKEKEFKKAVNERLNFLAKRIEETTGTKVPNMVPVFVKSKGIPSDSVAENLNEKIEVCFDNGELNQEEADICRSVVNSYQAAAKGHTGLGFVNRRLERAPEAVRNFFDSMEAQA